MGMTTTAAVVVLLLSVLHKNFPYSQVDYTEVGILGLTLKKKCIGIFACCLEARSPGTGVYKTNMCWDQACVLNCCLPEDVLVLILGLDLMM